MTSRNDESLVRENYHHIQKSQLSSFQNSLCVEDITSLQYHSLKWFEIYLECHNETTFAHGFNLFYTPVISRHFSNDLFLKDKAREFLLTIICSVCLT